MNELTSNGVVYVAPNKKLLKEACFSAQSLRKHNPDVGIVIYTDELLPEGIFDHSFSLREVIDECKYHVPPKLPPLEKTPFDRSLYIDADTYICGSIHEIFELLDQFDILTTHAPIRDAFKQQGLGVAFPEFNGGLLGYCNRDRSLKFLDAWMRNYEVLKQRRDQPALRKTFYELQDVRFYVLPPEFNLRINTPFFIGGSSSPIIFHGRHDNFEKLKNRIKNNPYPRVAVPSYFDIFKGYILQVRSMKSLLKQCIAQLLFLRNRKS